MRPAFPAAFTVLALVAAVATAPGCASRCRPRCAPRCGPVRPPEAPRPVGPYALYTAEGKPVSLAALLARAADADAIFFGELHEHPQGSLAQKEVWDGLLAQRRPVALAMEFFERDTQPAVTEWLAGTMDDATFLRATQRPPVYAETHGPLMAAAKKARAPVIAANAPRRLVSSWRKSDEPDYAKWRASLPEADQRLVPSAWSAPEDAYWERFQSLMGGMAKPFFKSQTLWDDAMAEAMADARAADPSQRVMLVVGGFHVQEGLGTVTKFRQRRPGDRVLVIAMSVTDKPGLPFEEEDRGIADVVLKVPPAKPVAADAPNPHAEKPPKAPPAAEPAPTAPQP